MISESIQKSINDQINEELYSAYLYLAMSAYCESINYRGFAAWMKIQSDEEKKHAERFYSYLIDRNGRVMLRAVSAPPVEFGSIRELFEQTLEHEKKISGLINNIYDLAVREKDFATQEHLNWFVKEQVEEESSALTILEQVKMAGDKPGNLMYIDRHVGKRGK